MDTDDDGKKNPSGSLPSHFSKPFLEASTIFMKSRIPKMSPCLVTLRSTNKCFHPCLPLQSRALPWVVPLCPGSSLDFWGASLGEAGVRVFEQSVNQSPTNLMEEFYKQLQFPECWHCLSSKMGIIVSPSGIVC